VMRADRICGLSLVVEYFLGSLWLRKFNQTKKFFVCCTAVRNALQKNAGSGSIIAPPERTIVEIETSLAWTTRPAPFGFDKRLPGSYEGRQPTIHIYFKTVRGGDHPNGMGSAVARMSYKDRAPLTFAWLKFGWVSRMPTISTGNVPA
jgi:hypothetical protein